MDHFNYHNDELYCEEVPAEVLAELYGTPLYVYSRATLERHWHAFDQALGGLDHLVCYAVKANSNLAVLNVLARLGSGFDIVSAGELKRVLSAGGKPEKIVFSGVGKQAWEMEYALEQDILCFNVESAAELELLNQVAASNGKTARISLRVNPDVDAGTHPYISTGLKENKFGVAHQDAEALYLRAASMSNIDVMGMDCHIGSQLTELAPYIDALERLLELIEGLKQQGVNISHLDLGGGLGIRYRDEEPPLPADWSAALKDHLAGFAGHIVIEPGRAIAGNAGILLTRVDYLKPGDEKNFAIIDAAMNDLIRPSLYSAWQDIIAVKPRAGSSTTVYDVVGAICETGDFIGKDRELNIAQHDLLAVRSSGAYGFVMSSNYNSRPRAAEVMVDGANHHLVRERESFEDLVRGETILP